MCLKKDPNTAKQAKNRKYSHLTSGQYLKCGNFQGIEENQKHGLCYMCTVSGS